MNIGVIGGSGLYAIEGIEDVQEIAVKTPFGEPSDTLVHGRLGGVDLYFLPRHGRGHRLLPSEINHRANIYAMKSVGVTRLLSSSAVGSLREDMAPGDIVLVDQFVDRTKRNLAQTFFGDGMVAHVGLAHPTCDTLRNLVAGSIRTLLAKANPRRVQLHERGTYLNMEGPAFSTLAESRLYRSWGLDVIGMTNLAEAKLAREAEICYLPMAMVTDYDCWHETHESVSVEMIIRTLQANVAMTRDIIRQALPTLAACDTVCPCQSALQYAIVTDPKVVPKETRERLSLLVDKYLGKAT